MSSVALVRRVDDLPEGTESDDPLDLFNKKRIIPNLDAPISRATNPKLWLFFLAYPEDGAAAPPQMTLEFVKGGKTVGRSQAAAAGPGSGRRHPLHRADPHRQLLRGHVRREGGAEAGERGVHGGDRVHPRALVGPSRDARINRIKEA